MSFEPSDLPGEETFGHVLPGTALRLRAPLPDPDAPHVAVIGGAEVRGRFAPEPFCDRLAGRLRMPVANLGVQNAGLDVFVQDEAVLDHVARASASVVQVMGAHLLSNRFYTVHPRRNDRFLRHSKVLGNLYGDIDFTEFAFVRHMLLDLSRAAPGKFPLVIRELEAAWVARMRLMLHRLPGPRVLLWTTGYAPGSCADLGTEPLFVTRAMVDRVAQMADAVVEVDLSGRYGRDDPLGLDVPPGGEAAAEEMLGAAGHALVAARLGEALEGLGVGMRTGRAA
ncbi:hypothetical protein JQC91_12805 [Jannaschia sp. Os4]|uniref:DUF6473 family protein n=1 Tax=Jannaschia sp. Os4 TaxID=2807617 RepID=UPI001939C4AC|nr:DUF6473 family protein [Jannaschia sp. Os4]MBM2577180.1 hypothetical protein [Jannaschia sp. Os4]